MPESPAREQPGRPRRPRVLPAGKRITTLLVDDHQLVRQGMRALLAAEADIAIVGEAQDGREAVTMATRLRPDVIVMDIAMPRLNGLEAARQLLEARPETRVLMLSAHSDEEYIERARELGAAGYVLKESSLADLAMAIRTAFAGSTWFSPAISTRLLSRARTARPAPRGAPATPRLSPREAEVLQLIAEGKANKQAAAELGISIKTVEKHRQHLMDKLNVHETAGLTRYAIAQGIIENSVQLTIV